MYVKTILHQNGKLIVGDKMIGKMLKYMRIKKGLNQQHLGKIVNISQQNLSRYEKNQRIIAFVTIEKIANNCGYKIYFENDEEKLQVKDIVRKVD